MIVCALRMLGKLMRRDGCRVFEMGVDWFPPVGIGRIDCRSRRALMKREECGRKWDWFVCVFYFFILFSAIKMRFNNNVTTCGLNVI